MSSYNQQGDAYTGSGTDTNYLFGSGRTSNVTEALAKNPSPTVSLDAISAFTDSATTLPNFGITSPGAPEGQSGPFNLDMSNIDLNSSAQPIHSSTSPDSSAITPSSGGFSSFIKDKHAMGNVLGLAGALTSLLSFGDAKRNAELQNKALKQNIKQSKEKHNLQMANRASFNRHGNNNPNKSALV